MDPPDGLGTAAPAPGRADPAAEPGICLPLADRQGVPRMTTVAIADEAVVRPRGGKAHAFVTLLARDLRVARRDIVSFAIRSIMQPALFVFVFAFVLPRLGSHGGASPFASSHPGVPSFSTILVPGLVATSILVQGLMAVTAPLMMELSYTREIEDRVLAPRSEERRVGKGGRARA